jgi:hypothetical protein
MLFYEEASIGICDMRSGMQAERKHVCGMICRSAVESGRTRPTYDVATGRCNYLQPHALQCAVLSPRQWVRTAP